MEFIFTIIMVLVAVFIVHKMLQEAVDLAHIGISVLGILIAILFLAVIFDAISFKRNFERSDNLFVVMDGNSVAYAEVVKGSSSRQLSSLELQNLSAFLAAKDYKRALGANYKLVLVNMSIVGTSKASGSGDGSDSVQPAVSAVFESPTTLISEYQKGSIYVYPETVTFRIMRYLPGPEFAGFFRDAYHKVSGWVGNAGKNAA